jgi:hypothetical protein
MQGAGVLVGLTGLFVFAPGVRGQGPAKLEFEVASVRAFAPQSAGERSRSTATAAAVPARPTRSA